MLLSVLLLSVLLLSVLLLSVLLLGVFLLSVFLLSGFGSFTLGNTRLQPGLSSWPSADGHAQGARMPGQHPPQRGDPRMFDGIF
ncbi:MAG: hypothetical protein ACYC42_03475, partial [Lysobacter sp.]